MPILARSRRWRHFLCVSHQPITRSNMHEEPFLQPYGALITGRLIRFSSDYGGGSPRADKHLWRVGSVPLGHYALPRCWIAKGKCQPEPADKTHTCIHLFPHNQCNFLSFFFNYGGMMMYALLIRHEWEMKGRWDLDKWSPLFHQSDRKALYMF